MKSVEIIGYQRANLGKTESKRLREEGFVPSVLYGGKEQIHFYSPNILFRELVYTSDAHFVHLNIEGDERKAILQDIQFHPVSEMIMHADFLELFDDKPVKMKVPVKTTGTAPGVQQGGKIVMKLKYVTLKAFPKDMPAFVSVDVSNLNLGKSIRVASIERSNFEVLNNDLVTIASVETPRALRGKGVEEEEGAEAGNKEAVSE